METNWNESEIILVKGCYENNEPLRLIAARLNYRHSKEDILHLAKEKAFKRKRNLKKQFCEFCFAPFTKEDAERVTHTFYNSRYCKKCNILLESTQEEAITNTIIALKVNKTKKTKLEVNNMKPVKRCSYCHQEKPVEEFSWERTNQKLHSRCKTCRTLTNKLIKEQLKIKKERGTITNE